MCRAIRNSGRQQHVGANINPQLTKQAFLKFALKLVRVIRNTPLNLNYNHKLPAAAVCQLSVKANWANKHDFNIFKTSSSRK